MPDAPVPAQPEIEVFECSECGCRMFGVRAANGEVRADPVDGPKLIGDAQRLSDALADSETQAAYWQDVATRLLKQHEPIPQPEEAESAEPSSPSP